jgi:hypothetical protein
MTKAAALLWYALLCVLLLALPGCELVEGIFKLGLWAGLLLAAVIVGVLVAGVSMLRKRA